MSSALLKMWLETRTRPSRTAQLMFCPASAAATPAASPPGISTDTMPDVSPGRVELATR